QRPRPVQRCPQEAHQAKSAVGKLLLRLPRAGRTPMLILPANVRPSLRVAVRLDLSQLRHRNAERLLDSPKPRIACPLSRGGDPFEEVAAERIVVAAGVA